MRTLPSLCVILLLSLGINGCATRSAVLIDSNSDWVMVDKPAKVSVSTTADGVTWKHAGTITVPPGMMIGPGPKK